MGEFDFGVLMNLETIVSKEMQEEIKLLRQEYLTREEPIMKYKEYHSRLLDIKRKYKYNDEM